MNIRFVVLFMLLLTGSFLFLQCTKEKKTIRTAPSDTTLVQTLEPPVGIPGENSNRPANTSQIAGATTGWRYEKTVDKAGTPVYKASINAASKLQFEYPYVGGSTATLTIRQGADGPQVYIEVANGQFNRSFQEGSAQVRFDDKPSVTYPLSAAANGRANIVFFDAADRFVRQIKSARSLLVQVQFAGQPTRSLKFTTAGLRWNR